MSWLTKLATGGLVDGAKVITSAITDYKSKKIDATTALARLENELPRFQAEINLSESKHPSMFVSGWRPACGWLCVAGVGYQFVFRPIVNGIITFGAWVFSATVIEPEVFVAIAVIDLLGLLAAMLGLTGWRSSEKWKGTARS
jgi:hypothetical protein